MTSADTSWKDDTMAQIIRCLEYIYHRCTNPCKTKSF